MYKALFSKEAESDINNIFEYIFLELSSPTAASNVMRKIEESIFLLENQPKMCPYCREENLKELGIRKLIVESYIVFYRLNTKDKTVQIMRVLHSSRDYERFL